MDSSKAKFIECNSLLNNKNQISTLLKETKMNQPNICEESFFPKTMEYKKIKKCCKDLFEIKIQDRKKLIKSILRKKFINSINLDPQKILKKKMKMLVNSGSNHRNKLKSKLKVNNGISFRDCKKGIDLRTAFNMKRNIEKDRFASRSFQRKALSMINLNFPIQKKQDLLKSLYSEGDWKSICINSDLSMFLKKYSQHLTNKNKKKKIDIRCSLNYSNAKEYLSFFENLYLNNKNDKTQNTFPKNIKSQDLLKENQNSKNSHLLEDEECRKLFSKFFEEDNILMGILKQKIKI